MEVEAEDGCDANAEPGVLGPQKMSGWGVPLSVTQLPGAASICHWYVGVVPAADTVKLPAPPGQIVWPVGGEVMDGEVQGGPNSHVVASPP